MRQLRALLLVSVALSAAPAVAEAAGTVSVSAGTLSVIAAPGAVDSFTVSGLGDSCPPTPTGQASNCYRIGGSPVTAVAPCVQRTPTEVRCPSDGVASVLIDGGDLPDVLGTARDLEPDIGTVIGGDGDDTLFGGKVLLGGPGNDELSGIAGRMSGGPGNDRIAGGFRIFGDEGNDRIKLASSSGQRPVDGGPGNDLIKGNLEHNRLLGSGGNDRLLGGNASDLLNGGGGRDFCNGGPNHAPRQQGPDRPDRGPGCETTRGIP